MEYLARLPVIPLNHQRVTTGAQGVDLPMLCGQLHGPGPRGLVALSLELLDDTDRLAQAIGVSQPRIAAHDMERGS